MTNYADIVSVFNQVQNIFIYTEDRKQWGVVDKWNRPTLQSDGYLYGDCEDFAIECAHRLLERGFPRKVLRLAVCRTHYTDSTIPGYDHAVLIVTDKQTFGPTDPVLDVNEDHVTTVPDLVKKGYQRKWAISSPESIARAWTEVIV